MRVITAFTRFTCAWTQFCGLVLITVGFVVHYICAELM